MATPAPLRKPRVFELSVGYLASPRYWDKAPVLQRKHGSVWFLFLRQLSPAGLSHE
ncbi:hypothetical protein BABINDRAFT_163092 [Babjeviella inositovora NRRL Y-12698]|uniref:Uncharacterized protein n=1 Tax=Babjeviella inositovora NRRL Y-12698 TaxID=984486 RepID=A0A1E3QK59_9ASCO|nr:uncharacterized protein BABINDRAFT_163092 [Babjeviella inositovora NRRL Y-12698]ODQ78065.1 hypothetical protein BABINDRAFT_163092 [Babjeviella inositovora NRRL Y-12698]